MKASSITITAMMAAIVLLLAGCTEDGTSPRDPSGSPGPTNIFSSPSSPNGDEPDVIDNDVTDDADNDEVDEICELEPPLGADERFPCCFVDHDCRDSIAPDAHLMRCYHSECVEGGAGTCRVPPFQEQECYIDEECPTGQRCLFEPFADDCRDVMFEELPDVCVDE